MSLDENNANNSTGGSIGTVTTRSCTITSPGKPLLLESEQKLDPVVLAYETYGALNKKKDNAILIEHAFSGDAHAAGFLENEDKPGWWDAMIGPGKAFDTDRYFVICSNVIGGCKGSTGPASVNPATDKPYGLGFPVITVRDMVEAQRRLIDHLGIETLLSVAGGSMGGMQALQWAVSYPRRLKSVIPIATTIKHSPQQIAFNEVGRQAIMADPSWNNGGYYSGDAPERGLAVARMIGHITYMSDRSMEDKFSRRLKSDEYSFSFKADFEVEGYLRHRGDTFVKRFDANSYLYITKAMDYFDVSDDLAKIEGGASAPKFLVIAFQSDWLYPTYQSRAIADHLRRRDVDVTFCEVRSTYGHDAFLLEVASESHLISHFLERVTNDTTKA